MKISVILCAHNSAQRLPQTLQHLRRQTLPEFEWELIVVDNASTDNTAEAADRLWEGSKIPLKLVREPKPGQMYAREAGLSVAESRAVCFVDDDNWLAPSYLATALEILEKNPDVGVVGGIGKAVSDAAFPEWMWKGWQSHGVGPQGTKEGDITDSRGFSYGAGTTFRRVALDQLKTCGFSSVLPGRSGNSLTSGDDVELSFALRYFGWRIYYSPRLEFGHLMPAGRLTWDYCLRLFSAFGAANAILDIYSVWHREGFKARLQQTPLGLWLMLSRQRARLSRRLKQSSPRGEGSPEALERAEMEGKLGALNRLLDSGDWRKTHRSIQTIATAGKRHRRERRPLVLAKLSAAAAV